MSLRTIGANYQPPQTHGAVQALSHQFEDLDQQNDSYIVGMWTFLVTEVMFFGALFLAYSVYRFLYPEVYLSAHRFLSIPWGGLNTFVLLTSSFFMVLGVHAAQQGRQGGMRIWLILTILLSFAFLGVKSIEYGDKFREGLFPGRNFDYAKANRMYEEEHPGAKPEGGESAKNPTYQTYSGARNDPGAGNIVSTPNPSTRSGGEIQASRAQLFFSLYFAMTGLHAIHIIIGIGLMTALVGMSLAKFPAVDDYMPTEMVGLYWHFVDIVWIFLFPLMYLIS